MQIAYGIELLIGMIYVSYTTRLQSGPLEKIEESAYLMAIFVI